MLGSVLGFTLPTFQKWHTTERGGGAISERVTFGNSVELFGASTEKQRMDLSAKAEDTTQDVLLTPATMSRRRVQVSLLMPSQRIRSSASMYRWSSASAPPWLHDQPEELVGLQTRNVSMKPTNRKSPQAHINHTDGARVSQLHAGDAAKGLLLHTHIRPRSRHSPSRAASGPNGIVPPRTRQASPAPGTIRASPENILVAADCRIVLLRSPVQTAKAVSHSIASHHGIVINAIVNAPPPALDTVDLISRNADAKPRKMIAAGQKESPGEDPTALRREAPAHYSPAFKDPASGQAPQATSPGAKAQFRGVRTVLEVPSIGHDSGYAQTRTGTHTVSCNALLVQAVRPRHSTIAGSQGDCQLVPLLPGKLLLPYSSVRLGGGGTLQLLQPPLSGGVGGPCWWPLFPPRRPSCAKQESLTGERESKAARMSEWGGFIYASAAPLPSYYYNRRLQREKERQPRPHHRSNSASRALKITSNSSTDSRHLYRHTRTSSGSQASRSSHDSSLHSNSNSPAVGDDAQHHQPTVVSSDSRVSTSNTAASRPFLGIGGSSSGSNTFFSRTGSHDNNKSWARDRRTRHDTPKRRHLLI
ncbi:hypothetical protein G7046_g1300 [Stylonectria norvegica]|nr:hypothetical protein G7046_g1300 [Stylonectria norvegica]